MGISSKRKEGDLRLQVEIKALFTQSRNCYGSRRISKALKAKGYPIGRYKVRSIMQEIGLECKQRRRYTITTQIKPHLPVAENKLNRAFRVNEPNRVWVADITYLWTQEGWLYLAAVLDLFSRRIVGWALAEHMKEELIKRSIVNGYNESSSFR